MTSLTVTFKAQLGRRPAARRAAPAQTNGAERSRQGRASARALFARRLQQRLALAHLIERRIEAGELCDYAEAARLLGVTRARLSQLADLVLLPADVQNQILEGRLAGVSERQVRQLHSKR